MRNDTLFGILLGAFIAPLGLHAQTVSATVAVGLAPGAVGVNPVTNKSYVANQSGNTVTVIDGNSNSTISVPVGSGPSAIAINTVTNRIYTANSDGNSVSVIDGVTNATVAVPAGSLPHDIAVNPITNKIYVPNSASSNVTVIDGATNTTSTVAAGNSPRCVAVNFVSNKIYVTNLLSNNVTVIDGATNATSTINTGQYPDHVAVNSVTNKIYVSNGADNTVTVIDGASGTTSTVATGTRPGVIAINPVTNKIYVVNRGSSFITVIDGATDSSASISVDLGLYQTIAVNAVTNQVYVNESDVPYSNTVTVIDGATGTVSVTIPTGRNPNSIAINPVTNKIYVANQGSNTATVIDGATNAVQNVAAGATASYVATNPVTNRIYTSGSGHVTVFDGNTNSTIATISGGSSVIAVNPITNKIYASSGSNITVIDGATLGSTDVYVGGGASIAINTVTNRIYTQNLSGFITVIDGVTNATSTIFTGVTASGIAVNEATNKIYVGGSVLGVIDGVNNQVATFDTGGNSGLVAVNPVTNKIYTASGGSSAIVVVDGGTGNTTSVAVGGAPQAIAVNSATNKIYVGNLSNSITVIDGNANNSTTTIPIGFTPAFVTVNPTTNKIYLDGYGTGQTAVMDGTSNSVQLLSALTGPTGIAVNPVTNKIYFGSPSGNVQVLTEQQVQANPLTVSISSFPGNMTTNPLPSFTFTARTLFNPIAPAPQNVYFQVDTWGGNWTKASGSGLVYTGTTPLLQTGTHILFAYATDGQEATSTQPGSPFTGAISAYEFVVLPAGNLLTLASSPAQGGTVYVNGGTASGFYDPSATVQVMATPSKGFVFSGFSGALNGAANPQTLSMSSPRSVTGNFTCTYAFTTLGGAPLTSINAPATGMSGTIVLVAGDSCNWNVGASPNFVTVQPPYGTGQTPISFTVLPNNGDARSSTISVAGAAVTVNQAAGNIIVSSALRFIAVTPCRVADTRNASGAFGGPAISGGTSRDFIIPNSTCGIPPTAQAYSMNVAVVPLGPLGYLTMWPTGRVQPLVATLNSDSRVKSNAAIVPAGTGGAVSIFASNTTDLVLDINGYFVPATNTSALAFYPLTPCRVSDTRNANGPFIGGGTARTIPVPLSACSVPSTAQAYSVNLAAVPRGPLGYLTAWPTGQTRPTTANLNASTGTVTSNAAIVPAGTSGSFDVFASNDTDLVVDINGYFAAPGTGGLSFYNLSPCRVLDSRLPASSPPFVGTLTVNVSGSNCFAPGGSQAYVFNATAVPPAALGYLTMWAQGAVQPIVATLNASDGAITGNMAIVPTANGLVNAFASNTTHLVLDIFGYFAP